MNNKTSGVKLFKNSEVNTLKQAEANFSVYSEGVLALNKFVDKPEEYYVDGDSINMFIILKNVGDKTITYDNIGNPTSYLDATLTWQGRELKSYENDEKFITYEYDENGMR